VIPGARPRGGGGRRAHPAPGSRGGPRRLHIKERGAVHRGGRHQPSDGAAPITFTRASSTMPGARGPAAVDHSTSAVPVLVGVPYVPMSDRGCCSYTAKSTGPPPGCKAAWAGKARATAVPGTFAGGRKNGWKKRRAPPMADAFFVPTPFMFHSAPGRPGDSSNHRPGGNGWGPQVCQAGAKNDTTHNGAQSKVERTRLTSRCWRVRGIPASANGDHGLDLGGRRADSEARDWVRPAMSAPSRGQDGARA